MLRSRFISLLAILAAAAATWPVSARAGDILFVSDSGADDTIAAALMADGHTVTSMLRTWSGGSNPALRADLSGYDAVYWVQDGSGSGESVTDAALFTNLTDYVMSGGRVFVTGYDSVASPTDPLLIAFVGGTSSNDVVGPPGAIMSIENSLTVGVVDVRGVTPTGGGGDTDHLTGLTAGTIAVCNSASGSGAQFTLRTLGSGEIAYVSNGPSPASWVNTSPGGPGAFNGLIRNFAAAADAAATEPGAPEIEFARTMGIDEGDEIVLTVTVTDLEGDPFTFSWDLDDDGTFGELMGMTTYTIPAGTTDGSSSIALAVQATDGTHTATRTRTLRVANVAPVITSSPPTVVSVGETMRYRVEVTDPAGPLDPITYSVVSGPDSAAFNVDGSLIWVPIDSEVTVGDERVHFEISVDDGDMGVTTQAWDVQVSPNHIPSNVTLLYPIGGIVLADTTPRLAAADAVDADFEDTLTYFFELDDEETFAEPVVARGEMLPEMPGFTAFPIEMPLAPGRYYWRAWAFDGFAESPERVSTTFLVAGAPGMVDAGVPVDGSITSPDTGAPPPTAGCACSTRGFRPAPGVLLLSVLGLALAFVRRRVTR